MDLQVALDRIPLERALRTAGAVAPHVDWIEVGTSLIKQFGAAGISRVVAAAGGTPVLADLKTADDVRFEFEMARAAGASSVTVLGVAPGATLDRAVEVSDGLGCELVVDLLGLAEPRIGELAARLPQHVRLAAHVGKDAQADGAGAQGLLGPWATGRRIALAGGLTARDLRALTGWPDLRVIVGSAVTGAEDPVAAVEELRQAAGKESR